MLHGRGHKFYKDNLKFFLHLFVYKYEFPFLFAVVAPLIVLALIAIIGPRFFPQMASYQTDLLFTAVAVFGIALLLVISFLLAIFIGGWLKIVVFRILPAMLCKTLLMLRFIVEMIITFPVRLFCALKQTVIFLVWRFPVIVFEFVMILMKKTLKIVVYVGIFAGLFGLFFSIIGKLFGIL